MHQARPLPRGVTYKNYKDLVRKWYDSWDHGCDCTRESGRCSHVPHDALYHMASLIAAGTEGEEGSWAHFETLDEAFESSEELRNLMSLYHLRSCTVHNLLVRKHRLLKYKKADQRSKHAKSTLLRRQACSAVWAGTKPWLTITTGTRAEANIDVRFEWSWYSNFTFMIDATFFEDGEAASAAAAKRVYSLNEETYPPHLLPPSPRIDATHRAMFYIVLHPHEGVIVGPDLVYTGSKVSEAQKHMKDELLKQWCASCFKDVYILECLCVSELDGALMYRCWLDRLEASPDMAQLDDAAGYPHWQKEHFLVRYHYKSLLFASVLIWFQALLVAWGVLQTCTRSLQ